MSTQKFSLIIPSNINFSDLKLMRDPKTGHVTFDWKPIELICTANNMDSNFFIDNPENVIATFVNAWYAQHLALGGEKDPVQEELIAEVIAEDKYGGGFSHEPGTA